MRPTLPWRTLTLSRFRKACAGFVARNDPTEPAVDARRTGFDSLGGSAMTPQSPGMIDQSMSGDGGSARLKDDAGGVQMDELGIGGLVKEFDRLRKQQ